MNKWAGLAIAGIWVGAGIISFNIHDIDLVWGALIATVVTAFASELKH